MAGRRVASREAQQAKEERARARAEAKQARERLQAEKRAERAKAKQAKADDAVRKAVERLVHGPGGLIRTLEAQDKEAKRTAKLVAIKRLQTQARELAREAGLSEMHMQDLIFADKSDKVYAVAATPIYRSATTLVGAHVVNVLDGERCSAPAPVAVDFDAFASFGPRALYALCEDDFMVASERGMLALKWVTSFLDVNAWRAAHPDFHGSPSEAYRACFNDLFGPLIKFMFNFYVKLLASCRAIDGLVAAAELIRRRWKVGGVDDSVSGPLAERWASLTGNGVASADWLVFNHLEQMMYAEFMRLASPTQQPTWDLPKDFHLVGELANEKTYYVTSWAFLAVTQKLRREAAFKTASNTEEKLFAAARFLRHDGSQLEAVPQESRSVDEVELKPGAMYRATQQAWEFGRRMEGAITCWLTTERLAVVGVGLKSQVEKQLLQDKSLREMFEDCFPLNLPELIETSVAEATSLVHALQVLVVRKYLKSRVKYHAKEAMDGLREKLTSGQATRAKLKSMKGGKQAIKRARQEVEQQGKDLKKKEKAMRKELDQKEKALKKKEKDVNKKERQQQQQQSRSKRQVNILEHNPCCCE